MKYSPHMHLKHALTATDQLEHVQKFAGKVIMQDWASNVRKIRVSH